MALPKFDHAEMARLYTHGATTQDLATRYGVGRCAINKSLRKQKVPSNHPFQWDRSNDAALTELYRSGLGCYVLAGHFGVDEHAVLWACRRLGIIDSSRQNKRIHPDAVTRSLRRRLRSFSTAVMRTRFALEQGVCEWCGESTGSRYNSPGTTYHHKVPIADGGTGELENCMLLHHRCHIKNYRALHNNRKFAHAYEARVPVCVWCGGKRKLDHLHLCKTCRTERKAEPPKPPKVHCVCGREARVRYCQSCTRQLILGHPEMTTRRLAVDLGVSQSAVVRQMAKLVAPVGVEPT